MQFGREQNKPDDDCKIEADSVKIQVKCPSLIGHPLYGSLPGHRTYRRGLITEEVFGDLKENRHGKVRSSSNVSSHGL